MTERLKRFYRTEAPPLPEPPDPPTPSWWERYGERAVIACVVVVVFVGVGMFVSWMIEQDRQADARRRAARTTEFRTATDGCRLIERTHGEHAEVVYGCDGRTERFPAWWETEAKAAK